MYRRSPPHKSTSSYSSSSYKTPMYSSTSTYSDTPSKPLSTPPVTSQPIKPSIIPFTPRHDSSSCENLFRMLEKCERRCQYIRDEMVRKSCTK